MGEINKVLVNRETDKSVWVEKFYRKGEFERRNRISENVCFFKTFQEAKDWLVSEHIKNVETRKRSLELAERLLEKAKQLAEPNSENI